jgi:hypothetical protein
MHVTHLYISTSDFFSEPQGNLSKCLCDIYTSYLTEVWFGLNLNSMSSFFQTLSQSCSSPGCTTTLGQLFAKPEIKEVSLGWHLSLFHQHIQCIKNPSWLFLPKHLFHICLPHPICTALTIVQVIVISPPKYCNILFICHSAFTFGPLPFIPHSVTKVIFFLNIKCLRFLTLFKILSLLRN